MQGLITFIDQSLSVLTLISGILLLLFVIFYINSKIKLVNTSLNSKISNFIKSKSLLLSFLVASIATFGSLFYSEVAGYTPCKLCWFQRIFMYPQMFILWLGLALKDEKAIRYSILLSFLGAPIAIYHYLLQIGIVKTSSCSTVGYSIDCASKFVLTYGYITIPMMALTAFLLILSFGLVKYSDFRNE